MGGASSSSSAGAGGSTPLDPAWAHVYGTQDALVTSVAVDASGTIAATGTFLSSLTLGASTYTCTAQYLQCVFLVETTSAGDLLWSRAFLAGPGTDSGLAHPHVAFGLNGEVVTAGDFDSSVDFGDGPIFSSPAIYVAEYGPSGQEVWSYHYASTAGGQTILDGLAVDGLGRTVVAGYSEGVNFGFGAVAQGNFTAEFDTSGVVRWSRGDGGVQPASTGGSAVATSAQGDVAVALNYGPGASGRDLGCGVPLGTPGTVLVAEFDGDDGSCRFSYQLGDVYGASVAIDPGDDEVLVGGSFQGSIDFGSMVLASQGEDDALLVRFDSALAPLWGKQFGDQLDQVTVDVTIDAQTHDVAITGSAEGAIDFGAGPVSGPGQLFVAVFTSGGGLVSGDRYGDGSAAQGNAIRYTPDGASLVLGGFFDGSLVLGPGLFLQSAGGRNAVLAELGVP